MADWIGSIFRVIVFFYVLVCLLLCYSDFHVKVLGYESVMLLLLFIRMLFMVG